MSYQSIRASRLKSRLAAVQAQITNLEKIITEMTATGVSSYEFDSGEGKQRTTRRSFDEIQTMIDRLYSTEESITNDLYGVGIVSMRLRRRP